MVFKSLAFLRAMTSKYVGMPRRTGSTGSRKTKELQRGEMSTISRPKPRIYIQVFFDQRGHEALQTAFFQPGKFLFHGFDPVFLKCLLDSVCASYWVGQWWIELPAIAENDLYILRKLLHVRIAFIGELFPHRSEVHRFFDLIIIPSHISRQWVRCH
jgi:hypothetical protein